MNTQSVLQLLKQNWKSGVTVALVSIPLSVSLAVASQSTPTAGIITAIWAGLLASIFGGSNYNIVGPTGALSGILATYALIHGASALSMVAILAGIFILLAFAFHLERFLVFVPGSAIQGFTLGVAFIIAFNQMNFAFGLNNLPKHEHFIQNLKESFLHIGNTNMTSFVIFAIGLAFLFFGLRYIPRIPGAIILAPIGILLGYLSSTGIIAMHLQTLGDKYPDIAPKLFTMPTFFFDKALLSTALAVALVAIIETMLSAKIADGMTKTKHNKRKEMLGTGFANIASGIMGGIPATAALARTSLNIKSGATHRMSAIVSSICIALISLLLLRTFVFIPLAIIASILVFIAVRMIEHKHLIRLWKHEKKDLSVALLVAFVTVYSDPIIGILIGTTIALVMLVERISRGQYELIVHNKAEGKVERIVSDSLEVFKPHGEVIIYSIKGQLTYVNAESHAERFTKQLEGYHTVILRLRELAFIDLDGIEAFNEIVEQLERAGKTVYISSVSPLVESLLEESVMFAKLYKSGCVYPRTFEVMKHLGF